MEEEVIIQKHSRQLLGDGKLSDIIGWKKLTTIEVSILLLSGTMVKNINFFCNSCNRGRVRVGELHKNSWGSFSFFSLIKTLFLIEEQIKARHDFFARRYNIDTWKILNSQQDWVVNSGVMMLDEERHDFGISHSVTCENFRIYWKRGYFTDWKLQ